jgi:glycosyltransferase involved in cell wall biosynthesis
LKIVHLVTSTTGGAAQAAIRLHEALLAASHDSNIISIERRVENSSSDFVKKLKTNRPRRVLSSAVTFLQRRIIQRGNNPVSPISLDLLDWDDVHVESADVIHLHAFYNLVSVRNFLSRYPLKRKVVTLHDERFYTGGCHQSFDCEQISTGCKHCPQVHPPFRSLVSNQKSQVIELIRDKENVVFVCPSMWILKRAMKSFPDFPSTNFVQVYNPIPKNKLPLESNNDLKKEIGFGFVSQSLENPIKNLNLLLEAFEEISRIHPDRYYLTIVGESDKDYSRDYPKIMQKVASSSLELQEILRSIDILVVPSTHDNLPNVMGEALMSGLGLIGSKTGGIPEIIGLFDQSLFENGDKRGLIQAMLSCELPDRAQIQNQAEIVFGYKAIAAKMVQVYSSILE